MSQNGKNQTQNQPLEAVYAVFGEQVTLNTRQQVIEMLERDGQINAKNNLRAGPAFHAALDAFREWSRYCEPGWYFQAASIRCVIIRLALGHPPCLVENKQPELRIVE